MDFDRNINEYFNLLNNDKNKADKYYEENLLDVVCDRFKHEVEKLQEQKLLKKYEYLIMTVGFSPEPLIMWIRALQPKKTFFICDDNTLKFVDYIVEKTNLKPSQFQHQPFDGLTITDVYKQIKEFVERQKLKDKVDKIVIDITGGKKSTVSGCTLAANYLGIDTVYVDYSEYHPEHRKPTPGTEFPMLLADPVEVFGDKEMEQAISKFNSGDFLGAKDIFRIIRNRVANPKPYEMYEALAEGYHALESMKFGDAYSFINKSIKISMEYGIGEIPLQVLRDQLKYLEPLKTLKNTNISEKEILANSKTFWHAIGYNMAIGMNYFNQEKSDLSALLSYRCLEMMTQFLLYQNGIVPSNAVYDNYNTAELLNRVNQMSTEVNPNFCEIPSLPHKVNLVTGISILKAIGVASAEGMSLKTIITMTDLRNKSRFAHGFNILELEEVKKFYYNTQAIIENVWKIEKEKLQYRLKFESFVNKFVYVRL